VLGDGRTITEVARDWEVSRQTIYAWLARQMRRLRTSRELVAQALTHTVVSGADATRNVCERTAGISKSLS